ncbi:hypothetical protein Nepgr_019910 [Nepenthes gracilis]|uniref:Uncharacterized protein n=1 Tax=Nepenthes gracilis TaxID=150966 RepID=A0AAD3SW27_NEPGR|nr:hypothetical protein Nepgr_019910 [Nepenthes gracilis]
MAPSLDEHTTPPNPLEIELYVSENYEIALNQSIQSLLDSLEKKDINCSDFVDKFYELVQKKADPPIETLWVYSALKFYCFDSSKEGILTEISLVKDLFQLISACSASCHAMKSVAFLAPVVFKLHGIAVKLRDNGLSSKREKKMMEGIRSLVNAILGFISVCGCKNSGEGDGILGLIRPLGDLVCLWLHNNAEESENLRLFFPLLSDEIRDRIGVVGGCDVGKLAGVVIAEVFLLRMCLSFRSVVVKSDLEKELKSWAVAAISGFQNRYFFEMLLGMLLEPTLPVTTLLSSEDQLILRKVLYDVLILVEYSSLNTSTETQLSAEFLRSSAVMRLIITHEAIELSRLEGDQSKAIAYINAFSSSSLPSQIIKLAASRIDLGAKESSPVGSSPMAFLRWLLKLESHGVRILDDSILRLCRKIPLDFSKAKHEEPVGKVKGETAEADVFFYIDNKGEENKEEEEEEEEEEIKHEDDNTLKRNASAAFLAAAETMNSTKMGGERKRKVGQRSAGRKKEMKFLKFSLHKDSDTLGELSDGSDEENLPSHEDMDEIEC